MTKPCPPPDPFPRKPRVALPRGATDCHFHVYGPAERYPMLANRDHTTPDASPRSARHLFETLGFERAVIVQPSVYGTDNRRQLDVDEGEVVDHKGQGIRSMRVSSSHDVLGPDQELDVPAHFPDAMCDGL